MQSPNVHKSSVRTGFDYQTVLSEVSRCVRVNTVHVPGCLCPKPLTIRAPFPGGHCLRSHKIAQPHTCLQACARADAQPVSQSDSRNPSHLRAPGQAQAQSQNIDTNILSTQHVHQQLPSLQSWPEQCRTAVAVCVSCIVSVP